MEKKEFWIAYKAYRKENKFIYQGHLSEVGLLFLEKLSGALIMANSIGTFKNLLKTHLFP